MNAGNAMWVLGHRIRPLETDESYGMVEVTSPPRVPGPPPHFHKDANEFFLVVKGTLDVMHDGRWERHAAGSFVDLPPGTTHTFINNTDEDVVWVTGWRPKGFQQFFADFGVPVDTADAVRRSVDPDVIQNVVRSVERYGMHLS
ncbi:cupin domain-containing protein [Caldimonas tepidiphila]|uniref:cupin domain-containing protein n=1 Tax=Caldimonas tepidiphila TaxID=2315841 RepID=UPI000E5B0CA1|nr:cupin domain-containing protein [Caldimonas tepidiphila]